MHEHWEKVGKKLGAELGIDKATLDKINDLIPRGENMKQALRDVPSLKNMKRSIRAYKSSYKKEVKPILVLRLM